MTWTFDCMADAITNLLVGVAVSLSTTNYSHTTIREIPCHLCDTPHAYELVQVHNVWKRRSVPVLGEDGKVTLFEAGEPVVINVLSTTNLAQLQHPHAMPVPATEVPGRNAAMAADLWAEMQRLERFDPAATLPPPIPRQRAYVVPPVVP